MHVPYEVTVLAQKQEGVALSFGHQMMQQLYAHATDERIQLVSGRDETETWKSVHSMTLHPMIKLFRKNYAKMINKKFLVTLTPDEHTLLSLVMDPTFDTSKDGDYMNGHAAKFALAHAAYLRALRARYLHMVRSKASATPPRAVPTPATDAPITATATPTATPITATATPGSTTAVRRLPWEQVMEVAAAAAQPEAPAKKRKVAPPSVLTLCKPKEVVKETTPTAVEDSVITEQRLFEALSLAVQSEGVNGKYWKHNKFDHCAFFHDNRNTLPMHYRVFMADVFCKKFASSCIESIFSGAGALMGKCGTLSPDLLELYMFIHYNMRYDWMRPSTKEIVAAYIKTYGADPHESDADSESDSDSSVRRRGERWRVVFGQSCL